MTKGEQNMQKWESKIQTGKNEFKVFYTEADSFLNAWKQVIADCRKENKIAILCDLKRI